MVADAAGDLLELVRGGWRLTYRRHELAMGARMVRFRFEHRPSGEVAFIRVPLEVWLASPSRGRFDKVVRRRGNTRGSGL